MQAPDMKFRVLIILSLFAATSAAMASDVIRLSEPVASDEAGETFGALLDTSLPTLSLSELIRDAQANVGRNLLIETRVGNVCQRKGCFFMALDGSLAVRVSFRDYGFFIPTDSGDKLVTLAGELVSRELTGEQAAHFNADMGGSGTKPGQVYEIVADSVRIPR